MKKYKYYYYHDKIKETVGTVKAESIDEAIIKASQKKQLASNKFLMLFKIEEINNGRKN
jgi:hypothetical protein